MTKSFGKALQHLRREQGLGLRMAAEELHLSAAYLSKIEQDKEPPPRPEVIRRMATLFGGEDTLFDLARTNDPGLMDFLRSNPSARELVRTVMLAKLKDADIRRIISQINEGSEGKSSNRKERTMIQQAPWSTVWPKFLQNLLNQPRCPRHPDCPHVKSMVQGVINDVLSVGADGIRVRSHRTNNVDEIPEERFKVWWKHLSRNGSASLVPGGPNNPHPWRSRIVGAILATALPDEIEIETSNSIILKNTKA
ncbi:MAG: helix-turn-helix domain-containing protein [Nitrospirae bacterium]|nr:helix-turn-helix domain-containing protein [Nitrospirota bacterium]